MPEISYASDHHSCVVTIVGNGKKNCINPLALDPLLKEKGWCLSTIQNPPGLHISMVMGIASKWEKFVIDLKNCIMQVVEKPSLNTNSLIATYGMTASVPDNRLLNDLIRIHTEQVLDVL